MNRRNAVVVGILALGSLAWPARGQSREIDLRPKFVKGQETRYTMSQVSDGVTEMPDPLDTTGKSVSRTTQKTTQTIGLRFKVIEQGKESSTVEMIYDSLEMSIESAEENVKFNSATKKKEGNPAITDNAGKLVGSKLTLKIDAEGNITSIAGGPALRPGAPGDPVLALVSDQGVRELWGPIFTVRQSAGKAKIGESWSTADNLEMPLLGRVAITTDSKLTGVKGPVALIEFKGTIAPMSDSPGALGGLRVKDSRHEGRYEWDSERGMLHALEMTQTVAVELGAGDVKISSKSNTRTSVKRAE